MGRFGIIPHFEVMYIHHVYEIWIALRCEGSGVEREDALCAINEKTGN
jgi:hypothetical protein